MRNADGHETNILTQRAAYNIGHAGTCLQPQFDVAVVMPTTLRPTIRDALISVFEQDYAGRVQVLVGIDKSGEDRSVLSDVCQSSPENMVTTVFDLGYSTSVRHGGVHPAKDGGSLRTALSYLANSRYVAYLDDDNWWGKDHLASLLGAIDDADWVFSLRWFVDRSTREPVRIDQWESTGVDTGCFANKFGGFVDPNCLMIDKLRCEPVLRLWSFPLKGDKKGMSADRNVFHVLRSNFRHKSSGKATCYYEMDPGDGMHPQRKKWIAD